MLVARDLASWLYRGGFLGVAVVCGALIAGAVRRAPGSPAPRLLSCEPLRLIGLVSYGLYLWHWPVYVVLTPARTVCDGSRLLAVRFVTTFGLATLSFSRLNVRFAAESACRCPWLPSLGSPPRVPWRPSLRAVMVSTPGDCVSGTFRG